MPHLNLKKEKNIKASIFLNSLLILFAELALIRFLPAQISYLGYYSNFILLASFVGIGVGILLSKYKTRLITSVPFMIFFLVSFSSLFQISLIPGGSGEVHFSSTFSKAPAPEIVIVPFLFVLVALLFTFLSQELGKLFTKLAPITAYFWDVLGSLSGIIMFTICAFLNTNPVVWFFVFSFGFIVFSLIRNYSIRKPLVWFFLLETVLVFAVKGSYWSPYQKITTKPLIFEGEIIGYSLMVNNIGHQSVYKDTESVMPFYSVPYTFFENNKYENALIIGAGMGTDVDVALKHQVEKIDAVEIDPIILKLGKKLHPDKPYDNPRVSTYVNDARTFLKTSDKVYDLIVFALPDSLMLASSHSGIRLESFLFTLEAFEEAKKHLREDGLIVFYNFYRKEWIIKKLAGMVGSVFGNPPFVTYREDHNYLAVLMAGGRLNSLKKEAPPSRIFDSYPKPSTDDWPFFYLEHPSVPALYLLMLFAIGFITLTTVSKISQSKISSIEPTYFFLGSGFLLLETKNIVTFSLLFGSTWIVNALVFSAILTFTFLSVLIAKSLKKINLQVCYLLLCASLVFQYSFAAERLLGISPILRYLLISLSSFTPVFLANLIFAFTFKESKDSSTNFASNMLGAAFGGILEYSALLGGYKNLTIVVLICYVLAFTFPRFANTKPSQ